MLSGELTAARPIPALRLPLHLILVALFGVIIYGVGAIIPGSTTAESRIRSAVPERAVIGELPQEVIPALPPLASAGDALRPGAFGELPERVQARSIVATMLTDKALEPVRQQQERDRQAALQRLSQQQQTTYQRASQVVTAPGSVPFRLGSPITAQEKWIDVNLSTQAVTAMVGSQPVHYALATTGAKGMETPIGEFRVMYRVYNETMTSASLGIPAEVENYRLENVLFTQYFTNEGHALHLNYWRPDSYFGNIPSSHGCAGLRYSDAEYLWNFAGMGTRIVIHY